MTHLSYDNLPWRTDEDGEVFALALLPDEEWTAWNPNKRAMPFQGPALIHYEPTGDRIEEVHITIMHIYPEDVAIAQEEELQQILEDAKHF